MGGISVVILAYNEEQLIATTVNDAVEVLKDINTPYEVIVIDDGSTDKTAAIIRDLVANNQYIKCLTHEKNMGMGVSIKDGYLKAAHEFLCFLPGDGQFPPTIIKELFAEIQSFDFITTVFTQRDDAIYRKIMSRSLRGLLFILFGPYPPLDGTYMFRRKMLDSIDLISESFILNFEFVFKAYKKDYRYKTIEMICLSRKAGKSKIANIRKIIQVFMESVKLRGKMLGARN